MFFLQTTEVTQGQWKRVMEKTTPFDSAEPFGLEPVESL
jgi:formylglycine-generating enzyme required for sulfatase activity